MVKSKATTEVIKNFVQYSKDLGSPESLFVLGDHDDPFVILEFIKSTFYHSIQIFEMQNAWLISIIFNAAVLVKSEGTDAKFIASVDGWVNLIFQFILINF